MKIFADGADLESIIALADDPLISGFTTNPTLMRKAGVDDYEAFARKVLETITDQPISFEVFADEPAEMVRQARLIASWGDNVYVKIPVTNTEGVPSDDVIRELVRRRRAAQRHRADDHRPGRGVAAALDGRPRPRRLGLRRAHRRHRPRPGAAHGRGARRRSRRDPKLELLWASPREVLNILQAERGRRATSSP